MFPIVYMNGFAVSSLACGSLWADVAFPHLSPQLARATPRIHRQVERGIIARKERTSEKLVEIALHGHWLI